MPPHRHRPEAAPAEDGVPIQRDAQGRTVFDTRTLPRPPDEDATLAQLRRYNGTWERLLVDAGLRAALGTVLPTDSEVDARLRLEFMTMSGLVELSKWAFDASRTPSWSAAWRAGSVEARERAAIQATGLVSETYPTGRFYVPEWDSISKLVRRPDTLIDLVNHFARPSHLSVRPTFCPRCARAREIGRAHV